MTVSPGRDGDGLVHLAADVVGGAEPGEQIEAFAMRKVDTHVEVLDGEVDTLKSATTRGLGVRVVVDGRQGYASTADISPGGLATTLEEARSNAAVATPDQANGLPEPRQPADVDGLADPGVVSTSVDDKIGLAMDVESAARAADDRVRGVDTAVYGDSHVSMGLVSTRGLRQTTERTDAWSYVVTLASRDGETQTGMGVTIGRGPRDLDIVRAGREGAERAVRLLGADKPSSRRCPVVFDPYATASFLGVLAGPLSGEAVLKNRSLFADRLGETVAAGHVDLVDDGLRPDGPATAPWDGEGVPQQTTAVVDGGVLASFLHNSWTARRFGGQTSSTGNASRSGYGSSPGVAPTNLYLRPGQRGGEEIIAGVDDGVYVQDVVGLHSGANPISGEFSVGVSGLAIRDGQFAEPIREATVASTIVDVLRSIESVGSDLRFYPFGGALGGSTVLVSEMSVGGR